jgi:hypothetical protein
MYDGIVERYQSKQQSPIANEAVAALEEKLREAEQDGAEIALRAQQTEQQLSDEIARLMKEVADRDPLYCRRCERKRRILAVIAYFPIAVAWVGYWLLRKEQGIAALGGVPAYIPLVVVVLRWNWLLFKRRNAWVSIRDNNVYRKAQAWFSERKLPFLRKGESRG